MFLNKKRKYLVLVFALVLVGVGSITAMAAGQTKTATLYYNDISVVLDGNQLTLTNANGQNVEPFVIDGTTYLPVRAIGEALGLNVQWNGNSNTVYLSSDSTDDSDTGETVDMSTLEAYTGTGSFKTGESFINRQQEYSPDNMLYGIKSGMNVLHDDIPSTFSIVYLLGGEYTTFEAYAAPIDGGGTPTFTFKDADTNKALQTVSLESGDKPVQVSVDVTGIDKLSITYKVRREYYGGSIMCNLTPSGALYNAYLVK